eukprot:768693-Hanusia_phi.AAC.6
MIGVAAGPCTESASRGVSARRLSQRGGYGGRPWHGSDPAASPPPDAASAAVFCGAAGWQWVGMVGQHLLS